MAAPTLRQSARSGILAQNITNSGNETTLLISVSTDNLWDNDSGVVRIGRGNATEHASFTGITVVSTNLIRLDGVQRGLKRNATSVTDTDATAKRNNGIGAPVMIVHHSVEINGLLQKNADEVITGSLTFSNYVNTPFVPPIYTEPERDAIVSPSPGALIFNSTGGYYEGYIGGQWLALELGTPISFATDSSAGIVQLATTQQKLDMDATAVSGAPLIIDPSDTLRTLHPSNRNEENIFEVAKGSTGDRSAILRLFSDDTHTDGSVEIERRPGANARTFHRHRGSGLYSFDTGSSYLTDSNPSNIRSATILSTYTAGENLTAGRWVALGTDGKLYHAQNNHDVLWNAIGVVVSSVSTNNPAFVNEAQVLNFAMSNIAPFPWYLDTNGQMTQDLPTMNSATVYPVLLGYDNGAGTPANRRFIKNVRRLPRTLTVKGTHTFETGAPTVVVDVFNLPNGFKFDKIHVWAGGQTTDVGITKSSTFTANGLNAGAGATNQTSASALWNRLLPASSSLFDRTVFAGRSDAGAFDVELWIYFGYEIKFEYDLTSLTSIFPATMHYQLHIEELV